MEKVRKKADVKIDLICPMQREKNILKNIEMQMR